jgi:hypothetical protein
MRSKNISVNLKKDRNIPFKETYVAFYKSRKKVKIDQKFIDQTKNQAIILNYRECERLMNLLNDFVLDGNFKPSQGKMEVFKEE